MKKQTVKDYTGIKQTHGRLFVLNHAEEKMKIEKTNSIMGAKVIPYKDIIDIDFDSSNINTKVHEQYSFDFSLNTTERIFILFAATNNERKLWIHTF